MYEKNMERLKSVQSELQTQVALSDGFVSDFVFTRFIRMSVIFVTKGTLPPTPFHSLLLLWQSALGLVLNDKQTCYEFHWMLATYMITSIIYHLHDVDVTFDKVLTSRGRGEGGGGF